MPFGCKSTYISKFSAKFYSYTTLNKQELNLNHLRCSLIDGGYLLHFGSSSQFFSPCARPFLWLRVSGPHIGFGPITSFLQGRYSTVELMWQISGNGEFWNPDPLVNSQLLCLWATFPIIICIPNRIRTYDFFLEKEANLTTIRWEHLKVRKQYLNSISGCSCPTFYYPLCAYEARKLTVSE